MKYLELVEGGYSWGLEFTDFGLKENFRKYGKAPQHEAVLTVTTVCAWQPAEARRC